MNEKSLYLLCETKRYCCDSDKLKLKLPGGFENWGQAIESIWSSIESDKSPTEVPNVFAAFVTYAFKLCPRVATQK